MNYFEFANEHCWQLIGGGITLLVLLLAWNIIRRKPPYEGN